MYTFEEALWQEGFREVAGIDEAGRGPLAGPVVAGAVILPHTPRFEDIRDSKALTPRQRDKFYNLIKQAAWGIGVGMVDEREIDRINIYQATKLAMQAALAALSAPPQFVLIDGLAPLGTNIPSRCVVRGDTRSASIAAASIIAKVTRDRLMLDYHATYPEYGFDRHKGYPTSFHLRALAQHGPSPIHRVSFRPVRERCLV